MNDSNGAASASLPPGKMLALGFGYWLIFLLVLEPGNVVRALRIGYGLSFADEALRICIAACIGAAVTPAVVRMTRRFPLGASQALRNSLLHLLADIALAFTMILVSCILAAWTFEREWLPGVAEIRRQLTGNWTLLVFALAFATGIVHWLQVARAPVSNRIAGVVVKSLGRQAFVALERVDWIEAQGNYVALHVGSRTHLVRQTLVNFASQLDASRFVRIHRRFIVAIDRIRDIRAEGNGDATVRLDDGQELRASRRYRRAIRDRWPGLSVDGPAISPASTEK